MTATPRQKKKTPAPSRLAVQRAVRAAPAARTLLRWARAAAGAGLRATLRVVGAAEGRRLNRAFRGRNYATNVLSFGYGGGRGDLVLCHPVIAREARDQGKPLPAHYAHMVVHGLLHLRGLDHARRAEAARMQRREIRLLRSLGFPNPYPLKAALK
ncbi:MAG: rRNA maturation RNase YbeY [Betaproteobacteria bacterium]|nr:rRNA maturation RNase YbeY [Betaproteobacteria bacterium]